MTYTQKSYYHRGGTEPLLGSTIPEHLAIIASKYPQALAVISREQRRWLTYEQFASEIESVACAIFALGYRKGDRIGIWATNNLEWVLLQMATARIGVILVNINPAYRSRELAYALKQSEVEGLFIIPQFRSSNYSDMLVTLMPELKHDQSWQLVINDFHAMRHIVIYDPKQPLQTQCDYPGLMTWQQFMAGASQVSFETIEKATASLDCDDPINIQYTSGTTGFPKAVVLTHHNILNNAYFSAKAMHFGEHDKLCIPVPFYHCFGMVLSNLLCFSVGACAVIPCEHFNAEQVLSTIAEEQCTALHGVPTMFIAQLEHPRFHEFDLSSLRTGIMAGAPCPPALMTRVRDDMHCREILIGYGETEASPLTHLTSREDDLARRTETVGKNLPHQEVKIINTETNETVLLGKIGEICFRGYHIMRGYYNQPEKTAEAIDEAGWLHSGDLGTMDENGYVRITGRLKDMIIRGGENIYPREIEDFLFTHPKIAEAAVFGIPSEFFGEEVMAWIQLHEGVTLSEQEVRDYCKDNIAHFKIPRYVRFVKDFPMTVTGKLQKFKMREMALQEMNVDS